MKRNNIFIALILMAPFLRLSAQPLPDHVKMNKFISELMAQMTLDEKIGQLNLPSAGDFTTGQTSSSDIGRKIREGKVGGLFNIRSVDKIRSVQKVAVEESRLKIPLIFGMDVIHGYKSVFPIPLGLSCSWDMDLIEQSARIAAIEASADGICWTFSPMVDLSRDPRWGRVAEGSGEDPFLGGEVAKAMVRGYQGNDLTASNTIMSCVKHFALYGAGEAGRDYNTVDMSRQRMYNEYFLPYKAGVDAGAGSVMAAFNEVDGIPATGNRWLMQNVLRDQWGFNGFIVTDYTGIYEMTAHGVGDFQTVSAMALKAGMDMDMVSEGFLLTLKKSLSEGKISEELINTACRRILEAKYKLGLFDDPYRYCDSKRAETEIYTDANRMAARKAASESFVLLKNEGNILPLRKDAKIALIGPLADNRLNMCGTWTVAGDFEKAISVLDGIGMVTGKPELITLARGTNVVADSVLESRIGMFGKPTGWDSRPAGIMIEEAVKAAEKSDVVVAILGEASESSGECSSITNIELPSNQRDLLKALLKTGKPLVMVLFTGRPLAITWEHENVPAILNVWFGGSEAGAAVADVLFGDVVPSGKLTATFPRNTGQIPVFYNHKNTGRPLPEGQWFTKFLTNYLDVPNEPLYPFGYGLSYTTFSYSDLTLSKSTMKPDDTIEVTVKVTNTGNYDGKEVVQLYIRDMVGTTTRPVKELKGFQKVFLKKGETKHVKFTIGVEDLKFYNYDLDFVAEPGEFRVFAGGNSRDVLEAGFELTDI
ncbi:Beta-glucosidase BoGH3B [bioreactor metagenome]|jgi:beta-glucosidase|uniref:Periplasmic beta-glucosidase n=1 Tax=bioreactor metagenome TaxID=1076179 RepID=A0A644V772_9ZZZZ